MRLVKVLAAASAIAATPLVLTATPAQAVSPILFTKVYYDSPGSDNGSNTSVNGEYFTLKNTSTTTRTLTGWTVYDAANHVYTFNTFSLGAGKSVTVRTGIGTNTSSTRYWGLRYYVWNNTGDRATLKSSAGTIMDACAWGHAYTYSNC